MAREIQTVLCFDAPPIKLRGLPEIVAEHLSGTLEGPAWRTNRNPFVSEYSRDKRPFPLSLNPLSIRRYRGSRVRVRHSDVSVNPTPQPKNGRWPARLLGQFLAPGPGLSCRVHQGRSR